MLALGPSLPGADAADEVLIPPWPGAADGSTLETGPGSPDAEAPEEVLIPPWAGAPGGSTLETGPGSPAAEASEEVLIPPSSAALLDGSKGLGSEFEGNVISSFQGPINALNVKGRRCHNRSEPELNSLDDENLRILCPCRREVKNRGLSHRESGAIPGWFPRHLASASLVAVRILKGRQLELLRGARTVRASGSHPVRESCAAWSAGERRRRASETRPPGGDRSGGARPLTS
jgi:hypothetical protein